MKANARFELGPDQCLPLQHFAEGRLPNSVLCCWKEQSDAEPAKAILTLTATGLILRSSTPESGGQVPLRL